MTWCLEPFPWKWEMGFQISSGLSKTYIFRQATCRIESRLESLIFRAVDQPYHPLKSQLLKIWPQASPQNKPILKMWAVMHS